MKLYSKVLITKLNISENLLFHTTFKSQERNPSRKLYFYKLFGQ